MAKYVSLLGRLTEGMTLPYGYDRWGMKTVNPLRRTRNNFLWPDVGEEVSSWDDTIGTVRSDDPCPFRPGDGLTIALDHKAMSSGGLSVNAILVVAYRDEDVVGRASGKIRTRGNVYVARETMLRDVDLAGVDLHRLNARHADLTDAHLDGADLGSADLTDAHLDGADLGNAKLAHAYLGFASMTGANLSGAVINDSWKYNGTLFLTERQRSFIAWQSA